jgi:hypothetical protein
MVLRLLLSLGSLQIASAVDPSCCQYSAFVDWDASTGNILFRTGNPLDSADNKEIDFKPLMAQFKTAAEKAGATWPTEYFVQDISLWTNEDSYIAAEKQYWDAHPVQGNVTHWPTVGMHTTVLQAGCKDYNISACGNSTKQPSSFSPTDLHMLAKNYQKWGNTDQLESRLATVYKALHTKTDKPQVIFFHCTCGCDRTGEFYAAYAIKYLNQTWTDAMQYDVDLINRLVDYDYMLMSQWYCEYLATSGQYSHNDCGNCKLFKCHPDPWDPPLQQQTARPQTPPAPRIG